MTTEQDEALAALAELERLFSKWGKLTLLSSLQAIDSLTDDLTAANERIARLEQVAQAAARFRDDATGSQESLNALWDSLDPADPAGDAP